MLISQRFNSTGNCSSFEAAQQADLPGFKIREIDPLGHPRRAGERAEYYPVTYIEPLRGNEQAAGFDLASNPDRKEELLLSLMLATFVLVFSAGGMYVLEGKNDPQTFGSIPRAMWWSVCTLTTVGYGDIYPHTVLGKILGGVTSIAGIGLIAMPTGILEQFPVELNRFDINN